MGASCCTTRDRVPIVEGAPDEENFCFRLECGIKLHQIEYRDFQAAIKRFGYRINMTESHLRAIAPELHIDVDHLHHNSHGAQATAYFDSDFAYQGGHHNVENLQLMGWLLCKHWNDDTQTRELWHLINPKLTKSVTKRDVYSVITRLAYIAVNLNQKLLQNFPDNEQKAKALSYHKSIDMNRKAFLKQVGDQLPEQIEEDTLRSSELLRQFYRSYDLRMAMAGDATIA